VVVRPDILYRRYSYTTSRSATMERHFKELCAHISNNASGAVIEIGSNDGHFLDRMHRAGFGPVLGVDPAENLCTKAKEMGYTALARPWNMEAAYATKDFLKDPNVIVARHVFCHVDNWRGFIDALEHISTTETLVVIEVPYADDLLRKVELDTIYHEHLSYFTIRALASLLQDTRFHVHDVTRFSIHGGSLVVMLRHNDSIHAPNSNVSKFFLEENTNLDRWREFAVNAEFSIERLRDRVTSLHSSGKMVVGYGASAKSTVWIHAARISQSLEFLVDSTEEKIERCSPGTDLQILSEKLLPDGEDGAAVLFAWNYADEIVAKNRAFTDNGGIFINPVTGATIGKA